MELTKTDQKTDIPAKTETDLANSPDALWTVDEVASYLKLREGTVRSMVRNGKLPAYKVGRVWRFRRDQIDQWLQGKLQE